MVCGVCVCFAPGEAAARRRRLGPCAGWVPACLPTWRACVCAGCVFAFFSMCRTWEGGERAGGATRGWGPLHKNNSAAPACLCCVRERKGEVLSTKKAGSVPGKTRRDWGPHTHTGCAGAWGVGVQRGVERRARGRRGRRVRGQPLFHLFLFWEQGCRCSSLFSLSLPLAHAPRTHTMQASLHARPLVSPCGFLAVRRGRTRWWRAWGARAERREETGSRPVVFFFRSLSLASHASSHAPATPLSAPLSRPPSPPL